MIIFESNNGNAKKNKVDGNSGTIGSKLTASSLKINAMKGAISSASQKVRQNVSPKRKEVLNNDTGVVADQPKCARSAFSAFVSQAVGAEKPFLSSMKPQPLSKSKNELNNGTTSSTPAPSPATTIASSDSTLKISRNKPKKRLTAKRAVSVKRSLSRVEIEARRMLGSTAGPPVSEQQNPTTIQESGAVEFYSGAQPLLGSVYFPSEKLLGTQQEDPSDFCGILDEDGAHQQFLPTPTSMIVDDSNSISVSPSVHKTKGDANFLDAIETSSSTAANSTTVFTEQTDRQNSVSYASSSSSSSSSSNGVHLKPPLRELTKQENSKSKGKPITNASPSTRKKKSTTVSGSGSAAVTNNNTNTQPRTFQPASPRTVPPPAPALPQQQTLPPSRLEPRTQYIRAVPRLTAELHNSSFENSVPVQTSFSNVAAAPATTTVHESGTTIGMNTTNVDPCSVSMGDTGASPTSNVPSPTDEVPNPSTEHLQFPSIESGQHGVNRRSRSRSPTSANRQRNNNAPLNTASPRHQQGVTEEHQMHIDTNEFQQFVDVTRHRSRPIPLGTSLGSTRGSPDERKKLKRKMDRFLKRAKEQSPEWPLSEGDEVEQDKAILSPLPSSNSKKKVNRKQDKVDVAPSPSISIFGRTIVLGSNPNSPVRETDQSQTVWVGGVRMKRNSSPNTMPKTPSTGIPPMSTTDYRKKDSSIQGGSASSSSGVSALSVGGSSNSTSASIDVNKKNSLKNSPQNQKDKKGGGNRFQPVVIENDKKSIKNLKIRKKLGPSPKWNTALTAVRNSTSLANVENQRGKMLERAATGLRIPANQNIEVLKSSSQLDENNKSKINQNIEDNYSIPVVETKNKNKLEEEDPQCNNVFEIEDQSGWESLNDTVRSEARSIEEVSNLVTGKILQDVIISSPSPKLKNGRKRKKLTKSEIEEKIYKTSEINPETKNEENANPPATSSLKGAENINNISSKNIQNEDPTNNKFMFMPEPRSRRHSTSELLDQGVIGALPHVVAPIVSSTSSLKKSISKLEENTSNTCENSKPNAVEEARQVIAKRIRKRAIRKKIININGESWIKLDDDGFVSDGHIPIISSSTDIELLKENISSAEDHEEDKLKFEEEQKIADDEDEAAPSLEDHIGFGPPSIEVDFPSSEMIKEHIHKNISKEDCHNKNVDDKIDDKFEIDVRISSKNDSKSSIIQQSLKEDEKFLEEDVIKEINQTEDHGESKSNDIVDSIENVEILDLVHDDDDDTAPDPLLEILEAAERIGISSKSSSKRERVDSKEVEVITYIPQVSVEEKESEENLKLESEALRVQNALESNNKIDAQESNKKSESSSSVELISPTKTVTAVPSSSIFLFSSSTSSIRFLSKISDTSQSYFSSALLLFAVLFISFVHIFAKTFSTSKLFPSFIGEVKLLNGDDIFNDSFHAISSSIFLFEIISSCFIILIFSNLALLLSTRFCETVRTSSIVFVSPVNIDDSFFR